MNVPDKDNRQFLLNIMRWLTNRVSIKDTKRLTSIGIPQGGANPRTA
jgi:hypothetical protein